MTWDQLLSSWAWCLTPGAQNHKKPCDLHILVSHTLEKLANMMDFVVGLQFLLTPWLLSTWFGDWLASQFPNPSWQHRAYLKHMQNTVILCHFVSLLGMLCHMGVWDMVADTWSASHRTCSKLTQTQCIIDNSGVGAVEKTSSKNSDFASHNLFNGGCTILGGVCQLDVWKNCQRKPWEIWATKLPN